MPRCAGRDIIRRVREPLSLHKLSAPARFLDLSDYARPLAALIVRALVPTRVSPIHITLAFTIVGGAAAGLLTSGSYAHRVGAGLLLLLKSTLDAADGSLARARGRPSRVGRYLDSICDFLVNLAVFGGLAWAEAAGAQSTWPFPIAAAALLAATLEGSVFHYYYLLQRRLTGGDETSLFDESQAHPFPWDHPGLTRALQQAYLAIYGWQDSLVGWLDHVAIGTDKRNASACRSAAPSHGFLTATTALGLGSQLLLIAVCAAINRPFWAVYVFLGPGIALWAMLLLMRRRSYREK